MTAWNFRIMRTNFGEGYDDLFGIHEVYYDGNGKPFGSSEKPTEIGYCDSVESFRWILEKMLEALDKPVLTDEDFK